MTRRARLVCVAAGAVVALALIDVVWNLAWSHAARRRRIRADA